MARSRLSLSVAEIEDRLEEAARTLRRLPDPPGSGPRGYGSSWPDYVQEAHLAYGYDRPRMRVVPSTIDIARMEECLTWLGWLSPDDARAVWMRAEGHRWRAIAIRLGVVRQSAWRRWAAALITISKRLERNEKLAPGPGKRRSAKEDEAVVNPAPDVVEPLL